MTANSQRFAAVCLLLAFFAGCSSHHAPNVVPVSQPQKPTPPPPQTQDPDAAWRKNAWVQKLVERLGAGREPTASEVQSLASSAASDDEIVASLMARPEFTEA